MSFQERAINLGHPSYVWREGQERRLTLIQRDIDLAGKRVLDVGCGLGLYVRRLAELGADAYGTDIDPERVALASETLPNIAVGSAEDLPFPDASFDMVFSNEVLEHVQDDAAALQEACRVLVSGGILALMTPNRWYPFETHGVYWRGEYHFGNIPLVNYLPNVLRNRLCPHVRAYTRRELRALFGPCPGEIVRHEIIFAGYDNIVAARPKFGRLLRRVTYGLEGTPLQVLGLSHLIIFRKTLNGGG